MFSILLLQARPISSRELLGSFASPLRTAPRYPGQFILVDDISRILVSLRRQHGADMLSLSLTDRRSQFLRHYRLHPHALEEILFAYTFHGRFGQRYRHAMYVPRQPSLEVIPLLFGVPPPPELSRGRTFDERHVTRFGEENAPAARRRRRAASAGKVDDETGIACVHRLYHDGGGRAVTSLLEYGLWDGNVR